MSNSIDPRGWVKNFGVVSKIPASGWLAGFGCVTTKNSIFTNAAGFIFDPTAFPPLSSLKLRVLAETTGPQVTLQLFNYTANAVVTGTTLTTSSLTPAELVTPDISGAITKGEALYLVQFKMAAGGSSDQITLDYARLEAVFSAPSQ